MIARKILLFTLFNHLMSLIWNGLHQAGIITRSQMPNFARWVFFYTIIFQMEDRTRDVHSRKKQEKKAFIEKCIDKLFDLCRVQF